MDSRRVARSPRTTLLALLCSAVAAGAVSPAAADAPAPPAVSTDPDIGIVAEPHGTATFTLRRSEPRRQPSSGSSPTSATGRGPTFPEPRRRRSRVTASQDPQSEFALGNAFRAVFTNSEGTAVSRPAKLMWPAQWMRDL